MKGKKIALEARNEQLGGLATPWHPPADANVGQRESQFGVVVVFECFALGSSINYIRNLHR